MLARLPSSSSSSVATQAVRPLDLKFPVYMLIRLCSFFLLILLVTAGCRSGCHPYSEPGAEALTRQQIDHRAEENGHDINTFRRESTSEGGDYYRVTGRALVDLKQGGQVSMRYRSVVTKKGECAQVEDLMSSIIR